MAKSSCKAFVPIVATVGNRDLCGYLCNLMWTKGIQEARLLQSVKTGCTLIFVVFYLLTSFRIADLHRFTHDADHTVDHSPAEENNSCHQALYHAKAKACEHEFHLTRDKSCSLCDAIVYHAHISESFSVTQSLLLPASDAFIATPAFVESVAYTSSDRGPPMA